MTEQITTPEALDAPAPSAEDRGLLRRQVLTDAYNILTDSPSPERVDEVLAWVWSAARQPAPVDRSKAVVDRFKPPAGWFTFGTHAGPGPVPPMEFYGVDPEDGMPLWERPAPVDAETTTEWRVESETTEDEFDTEREAREWLAHVKAHPDWEPAALMSRTVTITRTPWREVAPVDAEAGPWQHDGHRPVQHRDGKPPWCNACGYDSPTSARPAVRRGAPRG